MKIFKVTEFKYIPNVDEDILKYADDANKMVKNIKDNKFFYYEKH